MTDMVANMQAFKEQMKATWMAGDYGHFAKYLKPGALEFLDRLNVAPNTRMLDEGPPFWMSRSWKRRVTRRRSPLLRLFQIARRHGISPSSLTEVDPLR